MQRIGWGVAIVVAGLAAGVGRAGVYALDDPPPRYPALGTKWEEIKLVLDPMRLAVVPVVPDRSPQEYQQLAAELEAKTPETRTTLDRIKLGVCYMRLGRYSDAVQVLRDADRTAPRDDSNAYLLRLILRQAELESKPAGDWTTDDRINLGACYIRLGRYDDAVNVLKAADQKNFLVSADLAAAYERKKDYLNAYPCEKAALRAWPTSAPGWHGAHLMWYHRVESYFLKLLKFRAKPSGDATTALFDEPVAGGAYEAEMPPWRMWGDPPPDAYAVAAQLLAWSPNDDELYAQLGELLNSMGSAPEALKIFDELVNKGSPSATPQLKDHRKILKGALEVVNAVDKLKADPAAFQMDLHTLMWAISPRGLLLLPPVGGDLANETAMAASAQAYAAQQQPTPTNSPSSGQPDWRTLFIGFAAGLIVATLGALQWLEWRRRRRASSAASPPNFSTPQRKEPAVHDAGAVRSDAPAAPDRMEGAP
jgi:tetratricopeptide (TPR) repeat protein